MNDLRGISTLGVGLYHQFQARPQAAVFLDEGHLVVVGGTKSLDTWDLTQGTVKRHPVKASELLLVALSPDRRYLAAVGKTGAIWEVDGWKEVAKLKASAPTGLQFSANGQTLYLGEGTKVSALSVPTLAETNVWELPKSDKGYRFGRDGVVVSAAGVVYGVARLNGQPTKLYRFEPATNNVASALMQEDGSLTISPSGVVVFAGPRPQELDPLTLALKGALPLGAAARFNATVPGTFVDAESFLATEVGNEGLGLSRWTLGGCAEVWNTIDGVPVPAGGLVSGPAGRVAIVCADRVVVAQR